jgi:hypothetical protein
LKRNKLKDNKGQFYYEYVIYEVPYTLDMTESVPHTQNLHTGNLHKENLYVENNRQINIEKESIEEENIEKIYIDKGVHPSLIELFNEYLEIRKSIQAPLTERGLKMLITRAIKLSNGNVTIQKLMLENAIMNRWKNIYKPKEQEISSMVEVQRNELKSFYGL